MNFRSSLSLALLSAALTASAQVSYFEDFQGTGSVGSEWSSTSIVNVQSGRTGLGRFGNETATLTLSGFAPGQAATLAFDLYVLSSWDGSGQPGPDTFRAAVNDVNVLDATFAVRPEWRQSYSPATPLGGGDFAGLTGADESGNLDYNFYGSAVYKFGGTTNPSFTFTPTSSTVTFKFTGAGLQDLNDESWAIDNVRVTQAVPEPASMAALGLGAAALMRRRKKD